MQLIGCIVYQAISTHPSKGKASEWGRAACKECCKGLGSICTGKTEIEHIKISDLYFETPPGPVPK